MPYISEKIIRSLLVKDSIKSRNSYLLSEPIIKKAQDETGKVFISITGFRKKGKSDYQYRLNLLDSDSAIKQAEGKMEEMYMITENREGNIIAASVF